MSIAEIDSAFIMHPIVESVLIRRIHKGQPIESELLIGFTPAADGPALLAIAEGWMERKQRFKYFATYEVVELSECVGLRMVKLVRNPEVVKAARAKGSDESDHYVLSFSPAGLGTCDCWGADATARHERICKHRAALARLIELGHL